MKLHLYSLIFLNSLLISPGIKSQLYVTAGSNLSQVYLTPSMHDYQTTYDYAFGYSFGVLYNHQFNEMLSSTIGTSFIWRNVDPIYSTWFYNELYTSELTSNSQNILCVPISFQVKTCKNIHFLTGFDFNMFLNEIDTRYENRIDPHLKFGTAFKQKKWSVDAGYTFSITPYRKNEGYEYDKIQGSGYYYKSRCFYINFNYLVFSATKE